MEGEGAVTKKRWGLFGMGGLVVVWLTLYDLILVLIGHERQDRRIAYWELIRPYYPLSEEARRYVTEEFRGDYSEHRYDQPRLDFRQFR